MTGMQAVLLPVGVDLYAVPVACVREVVAAPAVTRLVTAPSTVLGLLNVRGEIVPLWDTAALLGVGHLGAAPFAMVLRTEQGLAGLTASAFPERALLDAPAGPSELHGTVGAYRLGERVAVLIDPAVALATERQGAPEGRVASLSSGAAA